MPAEDVRWPIIAAGNSRFLLPVTVWLQSRHWCLKFRATGEVMNLVGRTVNGLKLARGGGDHA
jgi:hypothetical protein